MPIRPAGRPRICSTCCASAWTRADSCKWPEWALITTGQPAASTEAVSPPGTLKANGELLAENIATGPSGTRVRTMAGWRRARHSRIIDMGKRHAGFGQVGKTPQLECGAIEFAIQA